MASAVLNSTHAHRWPLGFGAFDWISRVSGLPTFGMMEDATPDPVRPLDEEFEYFLAVSNLWDMPSPVIAQLKLALSWGRGPVNRGGSLPCDEDIGSLMQIARRAKEEVKQRWKT